MNSKKSVVLLVFLFLILASFIYVSAITGSIGNARMVLRANLGDKIDKSILVKNVNNVSINIELNAEGDLAEDIIIKDKEFPLSPGEEKKASFTINVKKSGTTESKINVKFSPVEGRTGVGLSSTIIVIANEKKGFTQMDGVILPFDEDARKKWLAGFFNDLVEKKDHLQALFEFLI